MLQDIPVIKFFKINIHSFCNEALLQFREFLLCNFLKDILLL